jgi:carbon storage regulator
MLILARKSNESVIIDGRIVVKIMRIEGEVVKLGIEAPSNIPIFRQEVYEEIQRNNREALTQGRPFIPKLRKQSTQQIHPNKAQLDVEVAPEKHTEKGQ